MHKQKTTFRALVISSLEKSLAKSETESFQLRDAAVGKQTLKPVSNELINQSIDQLREPGHMP